MADSPDSKHMGTDIPIESRHIFAHVTSSGRSEYQGSNISARCRKLEVFVLGYDSTVHCDVGGVASSVIRTKGRDSLLHSQSFFAKYPYPSSSYSLAEQPASNCPLQGDQGAELVGRSQPYSTNEDTGPWLRYVVAGGT
ncbi:hypothetical protein HZ326_22819 [Fusarium oxysporum f. sp. albedinis]|nr:hypothetical protein HZ326_22819 [Fusarium oxysporum f. sp. albedinis]